MMQSLKFAAVLALAALLSPFGATAQQQLDGTIAIGKSAIPSISWSKIGQKKKFGVGYGLRLSGVFSSRQDYLTAPAKLTSGRTGPGVLFVADLLEENLDTLQLQRSRIFSLNAFVVLQYRVSDKFALGFNIDALGFSFGGRQTALFNPPQTNQGTTAKPTAFNALLISDNDRGTLNSEFYARYLISERLAAKVAFSFVFAEYTAAAKLALDNDRFRSKIPALGLGVQYILP
jgi:hypothetical protein